MYELLLLRYGEIGLKGSNRSTFEQRLVKNIRQAVADLPPRKISHSFGRIYVQLLGDTEAVVERLQRVFGLVSMSPAVVAPLDLGSIQEAALKVMQNGPAVLTFKVETRRPNKKFPLQSPEISREVGHYLLMHNPGLAVDVHQPDRVINIEVREHDVYVFGEVFKGPGGLPVGVTGQGLLLLSGGIDSPVAGWLGMKRGLKIVALHFYSYPFTGERSKEKVLDLCKVLALYGGEIKLYIAPFTDIQKNIRQRCHEELYVTIMRRMMFRIAKKIAEKDQILALLTGESLGQVASQTLYSMHAINEAVDLPVLRPLITMDKTEIIELARQIRTFDISTRPYEDCCTLFVPRHPSIRPRMDKVYASEKNLAVTELVDACVANLETVLIKP
ncbi:MAG: tRNA uracil 4-sulfurtransferase ThiI [Bacillota bacterium]